MQRHPVLEELCDNIKASGDDVWKKLYPRRMLVPNQHYMNPKYYAANLCSSLLQLNNAQQNIVSSVLVMTARKLIQNQVPTYFLGEEFVEDVSMSKIEDNFTADQLHWPEDSMLFILPEPFSRRYNNGLFVPTLTISHMTPEEVFDGGNTVKETREDLKGKKWGMVAVTFQLFKTPDDLPVDYIWQYPDCLTFKEVTETSKTGKMATTDFEQWMLDTGLETHIGLTDEENEAQMLERMHALSLKLLLAMTAEPGMIIKESCIKRKPKKGGREIGDLWEPRTLGWKYRRPRNDQGGGGYHQRVHRHPGYFRWNQHYGPGNTLTKTIWIKPYWIGLKRAANAND